MNSLNFSLHYYGIWIHLYTPFRKSANSNYTHKKKLAYKNCVARCARPHEISVYIKVKKKKPQISKTFNVILFRFDFSYDISHDL